MAKLLSQRKYAKHRGVTLRAVQKAIATARITLVLDPVSGKPKIDPEIADAQWLRNTDVDQQLRGNGGVMPRGPAAPELELGAPGGGDEAEDDDGGGGGDRDELRRHKTEGAQLDVELQRLELAKRRGETLAVDDQRRVSARRYRSLRDQVLAIPDRMAWLSREDRLKLAGELKRVLHELADDARDESVAGTEERVAA